MRLLTAHVQNFGSYRDLWLDYTNQGLTLVSGATGSGKSTLCDVACWGLFGQTAKNGNADEVRSWQTPSEPTIGVLRVELIGTIISITRVRGKASQNDLYWIEESDPKIEKRGKDITETQNLLEKRLGISAYLYLAGGYYSEFSPTGSFFTAKASERRAVFEQIVSLDFAVFLDRRSKEERASIKKEIRQYHDELKRLEGRIEQSLSSQENAERAAKTWEQIQQRNIEVLQLKFSKFEKEKQEKIQKITAEMNDLSGLLESPRLLESLKKEIEISSRCQSCGGLNQEAQQRLLALNTRMVENEGRLADLQTLEMGLEDLKILLNPYIDQLELQITTKNPHLTSMSKVQVDTTALNQQLNLLKEKEASSSKRFEALICLSDLSAKMRAVLLGNAVNTIEKRTNELLEKHFDAELRVEFALTGSDSLDVSITKAGYESAYRQLSKGQRQLLRLCFSVSVMEAASNNAGVHFSQLMFDEALDGLDSALKVKAFALFETLAQTHESVMVIDHNPDFQELFDHRYEVTIDGDCSVLEVSGE
jgi:DNA repair exonuclease SbcCD ATPase subunit